MICRETSISSNRKPPPKCSSRKQTSNSRGFQARSYLVLGTVYFVLFYLVFGTMYFVLFVFGVWDDVHGIFDSVCDIFDGVPDISYGVFGICDLVVDIWYVAFYCTAV